MVVSVPIDSKIVYIHLLQPTKCIISCTYITVQTSMRHASAWICHLHGVHMCLFELVSQCTEWVLTAYLY